MMTPNGSYRSSIFFHTQHSREGSVNGQENAPAMPVTVEKTAQLVNLLENVN